MKIALFYSRTSSERQRREGNGSESQKTRCEQYAKSRGYLIGKYFKDEAVSGAKSDRPGFNELLSYIDNHQDGDFLVVIDDLSRLARDMQVHLQLRQHLRDRSVTVESPNFKFEDDPEGIFVENVIAAKAQLDREQNARQVRQKMQARLESGFWPFCTPPGLKNIKHEVYKKILNGLVQPYADIYKEAIEKYANDELNTLEEVKSFIDSKYRLEKINKEISLNGVTRILSNPLYAGLIKYEPWGILLKKAKHDGFIDKQTYDMVQNKLSGKAKPRLRKDYNLDFPLRGWVLCDVCEEPMTAAWTKGKLKRHPYYWCKNKDCPMVWKTVKKDSMNGKFELILQGAKPTKELFELTKSIFEEVWESKKNESILIDKTNVKKAEEIDVKINNLTARIARTGNEALINVYENEIKKLIDEKAELKLNVTPENYNEKELGTAFNKVMQILEHPIAIWKSDNIEEKEPFFICILISNCLIIWILDLEHLRQPSLSI